MGNIKDPPPTPPIKGGEWNVKLLKETKMKQGWEYKKLGEVCSKITDGSHNPPKGIDHSDYRMISSQNVFDDEIRISSDNVRYLTEQDFAAENKRTALQPGIVLLTIVGTIGRACVVKGDEGKIVLQRSVAALSPTNDVLPRFLMFSLIGKRNELNAEARGIAQKGIYLKQLSTLQIPHPPLSQQQTIVAELDKINEIIDLKKAQLKDLDLLAQSIFYEMFGDPIENPKGWEVHSMPDVCSIIDGDRGKNYPKQDEFFENGYCLFLNAKNVTSRGFDFEVCSFISKEKDEILRKGKLQRGDVVLTTRGTIGNLAYYNSIVPYEHMRINSGMVILRMKKEFIDEVFFIRQFGFHLDNVKQRIASGSAQPQLPISTMNKINIVLPPLSLQQSFASKIQAIESQKSSIKQSLADVETLLASRMDYWFGQ